MSVDGTQWLDSKRSARNCGRVGLPIVPRRGQAKALYEPPVGSPYIGGYPDRSLHGKRYLGVIVQWEHPIEPPEVGCPGAWYRSPFIDSLYPYMRRRTSVGDRVQNPRFDAADWRIQEAVMYLEAEQERWHAHVNDVQFERSKQAAANKQAAGNPRGRR